VTVFAGYSGHNKTVTGKIDDYSASAPPPLRRSPSVIGSRKATVACALGNALEMYDFTIYSFFAVVIAKNFFPAQSAMASLLMSLATFGVGFLMRPVGALVIVNR